jgi:hypothetical protein
MPPWLTRDASDATIRGMTTTPNPLTESHIRTLSGAPIPGTDSPRADELKVDGGDEILTGAGRRAYVEQVDEAGSDVVLRVRYLDETPGRIVVGRSVRFPRYLPLAENTTPSLVRELIAIKQTEARGFGDGGTGSTRRARLYEVVDELRRRGVLD